MAFFIRAGIVVALLGAVIAWMPWRDSGLGWDPLRYVSDRLRAGEGMRVHQTDVYSIDYPETWQLRQGTDGLGNPYTEFNGPATSDGAYSAQVRVVQWNKWRYRLEDKLLQFRSARHEPGFKLLKDEKISVRNATGAHRFELSYDTKTAKGVTVRVRVTETYILTRDQVLLDLVELAPERAARHAELTKVADSFQLA